MLIVLFRTYINRQTLIVFYNLLIFIRKKVKSLLSLFSSMADAAQQAPTTGDDHPPFDPSQPTIPISYPIKTLEELDSRAYFNSFHYPFNKSSVQLSSQSCVVLPDRPRLLVCHDMRGGYLDDKWVQGGTNSDAYFIWHWHLIDVFVFFSHNLVALPPPSWTNTAHRHGVKVLGTFITEWDEGRLVCDKLLATGDSARLYAERLAELAVALGFDGWLINMEIELDERQIPNLKEFVSHLTRTMHSLTPGSLVIWGVYDSVTIHGNLKWQDQLNEKNKPFFDICDGIFVNYTWKNNYPNLSAAMAGDRKFDVYMGIDVFGRGTFGGGQWNTNVALDVLKKENVSAAIFAPGWVYQTKQEPDFQTAQDRWWALVEESWGQVNNLPQTLPFYSNFDQGHGYHVSVEGEKVKDASWNNLSCQGFKPLLEFVDGPNPDAIQGLFDPKEASYNGGGNITFKGNLGDNDQFTTTLFRGELLVSSLPLHLNYSVKSEGDSLLGLSLRFSSTTNDKISILLGSSEINRFSREFNKIIITSQAKSPNMGSKWIIHEADLTMNGYILTELNAVCYRSKAELSPLISQQKAEGNDNLLATGTANYFAVLGHITLKIPEENSSFPPSDSWLVESQDIKFMPLPHGSGTVSLKIIWKLKDGSKFSFPRYNIYVEKLTKITDQAECGRVGRIVEFLGMAHIEAFYVSDLSVPADISTLKFMIQVCDVDGACQKLDDSPCFELDVEGQ